MNERIRELAGQAKFMAEEDINRQISYNTELKAFAEKFAELIVQECILTIQMGITRDGHNTEKYLRSVEHIKQIKQHFGVEE